MQNMMLEMGNTSLENGSAATSVRYKMQRTNRFQVTSKVNDCLEQEPKTVF